MIVIYKDSVVVLSSKGQDFISPLKSKGVLNFSIISELSGQEIVCVSGTVNKEGLVFEHGSNEYEQLGFRKETKSVSLYTEISSHVE